MFHGLMVVNAFLRTTKFDDLYHFLLEAARRAGMSLDVMTNAELCCQVETADLSAYHFVIFWDKDVQLAMQLEARGLRVFNSAQSILWCDDKALTYLKLREAHIPMPRTLLAPKTFSNIGYPDTAFLHEVAETLGFPIVIKECFGSFGQQVYLAQSMDALREKVVSLAGVPLLFQELIQESYGHDVRINVVDGRVVASMHRRSTDGDFRSNLTRGGAMEVCTPTQEQAALALQAVHALKLDFAGVDVLFGKDGPLICEVNSNAHFKTTLECTGVNIADEIMRSISGKLANP